MGKIFSRKKIEKQKINFSKKCNISFYFHQQLKFKQQIEQMFWFGSYGCGKSYNGLMYRLNQ